MTYPHVFAGNPLDRGERERRDEDWIGARASDPNSKFLPMLNLNPLLSKEAQPRLGWLNLEELGHLGTELEPVLLGLLDGAAYFVVDISGHEAGASQIHSGESWIFEDARSAAEALSGPEAGILAQARAQLNWHKSHGYCSACGHRSLMRRGGQMRQCPQCNAQHFPRTDPVVITVVHDGERCLLGQSRGRLSRMKMYSALAGFVDQGETIEEAVAREIMEEAGIKVKNIRYHSSQPWPFPSSLMIGCHAEAATTEIHSDDEEMVDVQWFERGEVLLALEGRSEKLSVPGPIAIAHHLIKAWATRIGTGD